MTPVILASGSVTRQRLLTEAGVAFTVRVRPVDEIALRHDLRCRTVATADAALVLADAKAACIAADHGDALVIGADQILDLDGAWLDKPADRAAAHIQLLSLRGRTHRLVSAVVAWRGGEQLWHAVQTAELDMRPFSDECLNRYLDQAGETVTSSVGAYQLEGLGAQLFTAVRGDFFTVLGLPLLPLLQFLREQGILST